MEKEEGATISTRGLVEVATLISCIQREKPVDPRHVVMTGHRQKGIEPVTLWHLKQEPVAPRHVVITGYGQKGMKLVASGIWREIQYRYVME